MRPLEPDDAFLDPAEEASLRRVMLRLRARLTPGAHRDAGREREASRAHAAVCGEFVTD